MRQLLYVSSTIPDMAGEALDTLVAAARRNNAMVDITGILLHVDGGFLQVLEGEERAVRETYARIRADRRHWEARLLLDRESPRAFTGWSMGFHNLRQDDPDSAGLFAVAREALRNRLEPGVGRGVVTMLEAFIRVPRGGNLALPATG